MSSSQTLTSPSSQTPSAPTPTTAIPTTTTPQPSSSTPPPPLSALWWNTNLPPHLQTPTCPSYLLYAHSHAKERANLSTPDALFERQSWPAVRALVAANRLDKFTRVPSELRRYRLWTEGVVREYGSVMRFVLGERLGWGEGDVGMAEGGFAREENYKILPNDWPYGIDPRITHLVVWTKFALPSDPLTDDLLPSSRAEIDAFVRRKFVEPCGEENVNWFRNWGALKSVHAVEHFHVLVFDPPKGFVEGVTGGDGGLSEKVGRGEGGGGIVE